MSLLISRRKLITTLSALSGVTLAGCRTEKYFPPHFGGLLDASDALTMSVQRMLMTEQTMAREYSIEDISLDFPVEGTRLPEDTSYQRSMANEFQDWRIPVQGLVDRPLSLSLTDLKGMPSRTHITSHSCEGGWTAIGQWTGVPLSHVLELAGMQPEARYVTFECVDGWYDFVDLFDALHAQTILAYGMNGGDLPIQHGAPVRLRVERHLGYKSLKFVKNIEVVDKPDRIADRMGFADLSRLFHFSWYAGI
jgi:DMSO/TMAO reductase YedYZ molybdopterin-dependent catalytic subunit